MSYEEHHQVWVSMGPEGPVWNHKYRVAPLPAEEKSKIIEQQQDNPPGIFDAYSPSKGESIIPEAVVAMIDSLLKKCGLYWWPPRK